MNIKNMKPHNTFIVIIIFLISTSVLAETETKHDELSIFPSEISLWKEKSFKGHTNYQTVLKEGKLSINASCNKTASAFYNRIAVDLVKTPILHWSWKIDSTHTGLDDISKLGDDYAARVYVVHKGAMPWDINAVNYVWANMQPKGASWPNAYTERAIMVAQESGKPNNKEIWIKESRNVLLDYKKYFGKDINKLDGVAIMTDCDNGKGKTTGYYRDIYFTAE